MEKLIGGEKTVISTIEIDLSYKIFIVLGLHHERRQFSDLIVECKEILICVRKILKSMAVDDPELEPKVVDEPESGPKVVTKLVSLQEEICSRLTEVEEPPLRSL